MHVCTKFKPSGDNVLRLQIGMPYQYMPTSGTLQHRLHTADMMVRMAAAKCVPSLFSGPVALLAMRPSKAARAQRCATHYADTLRRHQRTTRHLRIVYAALVAVVAAIVASLLHWRFPRHAVPNRAS